MNEKVREDWLTLPNVITFGRIIGTIGVWWHGGWFAPLMFFQHPWLFAIVALSDFLDGYIARNWNMRSKVGGVLDPIADKILVLPLVFFFWLLTIFPFWVLGLVILREIIVLCFKCFAAGGGQETYSLWLGKCKFAIECIAIYAILMSLPALGFYIFIFAILTSYASLIQYGISYGFFRKAYEYLFSGGGKC